MPLKRPGLVPAPSIVLGLLCLMYLITYVNRQNMATAGGDIIRDLHLTRGQLGKVIGAFGVTYAIFQIVGGWIGDRWGPRRTLFVCGLVWATATALTGLVGGLTSLYLVRLLLGVGEGATFPVATRAMQSWTPPERRGFAQGLTHAFSRIGNAVTPPIVAWLITVVAWRGIVRRARHRQPRVGGRLGLVLPRCPGGARRHHARTSSRNCRTAAGRRRGSASQVPWGALIRRMAPVTIVYFCYGWTLWLYLNWLPQYFLHEYQLAAVAVGDLLVGGVLRRRRRRLSRRRDQRPHPADDAAICSKARRDFVVVGFLLLVRVHAAGVPHARPDGHRDQPGGGVLLRRARHRPDVVDSDGHRAEILRDGERPDEHRIGASRPILSPIAFGYIVDWTGNWQLPFIGSLGLLLLGAVLAFTMHPERAFEDEPAVAVG